LPDLQVQLTGGYDLAERKVVCFLPSYTETILDMPISCIQIKPVNAKFAEELTHRDYLGAIMNLGIERSKVGDIVIDDTACHVICMTDMADYVAEQLHLVKHTTIHCLVCPVFELNMQPKFETISGSIASDRLDNLLSLAYHLSRTQAVSYIEGERTFVNGKMIHSNSHQLHNGDIVSVRGQGKFIYRGIQNQTKKGRLFVTLDQYC
ncbi:MAG: YlmH/Sll1252 family protein, partial [Hungatella sp.]